MKVNNINNASSQKNEHISERIQPFLSLLRGGKYLMFLVGLTIGALIATLNVLFLMDENHDFLVEARLSSSSFNYRDQQHQQQNLRSIEIQKQSEESSTRKRSLMLPETHRYAGSNQCIDGGGTNYAEETWESLVRKDKQYEFATGGYEKIAKGSSDFLLLGPLVTRLSKVQHEDGKIFGSIGELGVHHGRFTACLFLTARKSEKLIVADVFEPFQYLNVDNSGLGSLRHFARGVRTYGLDPAKDLHEVFVGSTDQIPFGDWSKEKKFEQFRIISVDAGHTAALTFNDLQVAFCNLLKGGIVLLDDFFHNQWPGVTEGFFQYTSMGPQNHGIYPFLRCEGKNFMTNDLESHKLYYDKLLNDPKLQGMLNPYAHETKRGNVKYEMNGVEYLRCDTETMNRTSVHELWSSLLY